MISRALVLNYPSLLAAALMSLPRVAIAYVPYCITPLLASEPVATVRVLVPLVLAGCAGAFITALSGTVSFTALAIQLALCAPFFMGAFGVKLNARLLDPLILIRALNVAFMIGGLASLLAKGFPIALPYIDYLPDFYWGFFGLGGARIGTVLGFFGLICEIIASKGRKNRVAFLVFAAIAGTNFLLPNFLLGLFAGFAGLSIVLIRNPRLAVAVILPLPLIFGYAMVRVNQIDDTFTMIFGSHPKVYQWVLAGHALSSRPHATLVGVGPGQFAGKAAIWASPASAIVSSRERPDLPGLFSSSVHDEHVASVLLVFAENRWAVSSSANKPYSSTSIIIVEHGLIIFLVLGVFLLRSYVLKPSANRLEGLSVFVFLVLLLSIDTFHDAPWLGLCMIIANTLLSEDEVAQS